MTGREGTVSTLPLRVGLPAWSAIAVESFGGPVAQIAVLHRVVVEERCWVSEERFQRALAFGMLLPGPEAQQLATYLGWLLHGTPGALVAGSLWLAVWLLPLFVASIALGGGHVIAQEGRFFATSALVTFGGAYAVLTYVTQQAVQCYHWVTPSEMVVGLGLAESTPGPLIQVVQFVAFLGAFRAPAPLSPLAAGVLASLLVTWVTFVPSFFFILGLAPFVERLAHNRFLLGSLRGITAAVFGAMLNLALWFALHTLFGDLREVSRGPFYLTLPSASTVDWWAVIVAMASLVAVLRFKVTTVWLLAAAAALGAARQLLR